MPLLLMGTAFPGVGAYAGALQPSYGFPGCTLNPERPCAQITTVDEAKTFYPLFGLGANVALIVSGRAVKYYSNVRAHLPLLGV